MNENEKAGSCESHEEVGCDVNITRGPLSKSLYEEDETERDKRSFDPDYAWDQIKASQIFQDPPVKTLSFPTGGPKKDFVRFVFISDTHGRHREVSHLPRGDVLVHAGDLSNSGKTETFEDVGDYFREFLGGNRTQQESSYGSMPPEQNSPAFRKVVCIAGNHDLTLDEDYYNQSWQNFHRKKSDPATSHKAIRRDAIYLEDEFCILEFLLCQTAADNKNVNNESKDIQNSVHIYGSPYSPRFRGWAFNKDRGQSIREIWNKIPSGKSDIGNNINSDDADCQNWINEPNEPIDVLITHGPPLGRGDLVFQNGNNTTRAGCYDLLRTIQDRARPRINVFGHVHEGYGVTYDGTTLYVNASTMNQRYEVVNLPIVVDLPLRGRESVSFGRSSPRVVRPSSLFCNHKTNITSVEEWIKWCQKHCHWFMADALTKNIEAARDWFTNEPPSQEFFKSLADALGFWSGRKTRSMLSKMIYHLYAEAFDDTSVTQ